WRAMGSPAYYGRLFIMIGGRSTFIRLVFAKNSSKGNNADVPNRFYPRDPWTGGPGRQTHEGYSCVGRATQAAGLRALRGQPGARQGHLHAYAQAYAS